MKYWENIWNCERKIRHVICLAIVFLLRLRLLNSCTFPRHMISAALVKHYILSCLCVILPENI